MIDPIAADDITDMTFESWLTWPVLDKMVAMSWLALTLTPVGSNACGFPYVFVHVHPKVGFEFTSHVDTGTSEWDIDEGHPLMEALEGLLDENGVMMPRHALVAALVGVHG